MPTLAEKNIYALIASIERDLASHILLSLPKETSPLSSTETTSALVVLGRDNKPNISGEDWRQLLPYLTLGQKLQVLQRNKRAVSDKLEVVPQAVEALHGQLSSLVEVRNAVFHAKPYVEGYYEKVLSVASRLVSGDLREMLPEFGREWLLIENSDYAREIKIPEFWWNATYIENNLPKSEYDDIGFIGRESDQENLLALLRGVFPIISVTGEGGIGKTALVLRCLTRLVEPGSGFSDRFDIVHWSSLKTTHLTAEGVKQIADALSSKEQLLNSIAGQTCVEADDPSSKNLPTLFKRVKQMLTQQRMLLVIDNLETLDLEALRPLFEAVPQQSKILLTSRLSLGGFDAPYPLKSMEPDEAVRLMRVVTRRFNVEADRTDEELRETCKKLFFNPLAIRWFAQGRAQKKTEQQLLDVKGEITQVLEFCFDTIYSSLDEARQQYLRLFATVPTALSVVQIALLLNQDDAEKVRSELSYLSKSNLIQSLRDDWAGGIGQIWALSDAARQFISSRSSYLDVEQRRKILDDYNRLFQKREAVRRFDEGPFKIGSFEPHSTDEAMVIDVLQEGLRASWSARNAQQSKDNEASQRHENRARNFIDKASRLMPHYYDVWRVSANIKHLLGDVGGAQQDFEKALSLSGNRREPLLWHYARFLLDQNNPDASNRLLSEVALRSDLPVELLDILAETQFKMHRYEHALNSYEMLYSRSKTSNVTLRATPLSRYVACLREVASREVDRKDSLMLLGQAFRLSLEACEIDRPQKVIMTEVLKCFQKVCQLTAEHQLGAQWSGFQKELNGLAALFPLVGDDISGIQALRRACPEFSESEEIKRLLVRQSLPLVQDRTKFAPILGRLKPVPKRPNGFYPPYTFIQGDDAQDYFLESTEIVGVSWTKLCRMSHSRPYVEFWPLPPRPQEDQPRAIEVRLLDEPVQEIAASFGDALAKAQAKSQAKGLGDSSKSPILDGTSPRHAFAPDQKSLPQARKSANNGILSGIVKVFPPGRFFTFIAGDDGNDYYLCPAELQQISWNDLSLMDRPRVEFEVKLPHKNGKYSVACFVHVVDVDKR